MSNSKAAGFALVTGASGGTGKAFAARLAQAGFDLILVSDRDMELTLAQAELAYLYPATSIDTYTVDLGVPSAAARLYEAVSRRNRNIDILVNEWWTCERELAGSASRATELRALRVNVEAMTVLSQRIAADMAGLGSGRIVTLAIPPADSLPLTPACTAAAAYVETFSRELGAQLEGTGVSVTCVKRNRAWNPMRAISPLSLTAQAADRSETAIASLAYDAMMRGESVVTVDIAGDGVSVPPSSRMRSYGSRASRAPAVTSATD